MSIQNFAIIGAGCGGQSMAVILKNQGCTVRLMDRDTALVQELNALPEITLTGKIEGKGKPDLITGSAADAVEGADVILVTTTADGHEQVARELAPVIQPNQIVVLNPGMFFGSLAFKNILKRCGCAHDIIVAETADLMYACRKAGPGTVFHSGLKKKMALAAVPSGAAEQVVDLLKSYFPALTPVKDILQTTFRSAGAALHCVPMIMNVNRFDAGQPFDYYMEGITPSIARIAEAVDQERVTLAKALGVEVAATTQSLKDTYGVEGETLYEVIQNNAAYVGIKSPTSLAHRFCAEDTFGSLVGFATLAKELGIPAPCMDAIIRCISMATGIDYFTEGRTAEKVGLSGMTVEEICRAIQ